MLDAPPPTSVAQLRRRSRSRCAIAFSKIVGFDVTPRMPCSATRSRRPPRASARVRLSYQGLCPNSTRRAIGLAHVVVLSNKRERASATFSGVYPNFASATSPGCRLAEAVDRDDVVGPLRPAEARPRPRPRASARRAAAPRRGTRRAGPRTGPTTASTRPASRCPVPRASRAPRRTPTPPSRCRSARGRARRRASSTSTYAPRATRLRRALGRAFEHRHLLASEDDPGRSLAVDVHAPRGRDLVRVGAADQPQPGHRPQRGEVLDRLVRRAVLAEPDRVVATRRTRPWPASSPRAAPTAACSR